MIYGLVRGLLIQPYLPPHLPPCGAASTQGCIKSNRERIFSTSRPEDLARLGRKLDVSDMIDDESLKVLLQRPPLNDVDSLRGREIATTLC